MAYLMLGSVMILLSIVFRLAAVFRLTIQLLYALIAPLFSMSGTIVINNWGI